MMRIKVRNCIRPDTFRYHLYQQDVERLWTLLQKNFGKSRQFGDLDLFEIDHKSFLLRALLKEATITLIKKKGVEENNVKKFHDLIGFKAIA